MNRLELGRYWVARLCDTMPGASQRICIRMGWHLAALAIHNDTELFGLPDAALDRPDGGSPHFVKLRLLYQQRLSVPDQAAPNVVSFARPVFAPADKAGI